MAVASAEGVEPYSAAGTVLRNGSKRQRNTAMSGAWQRSSPQTSSGLSGRATVGQRQNELAGGKTGMAEPAKSRGALCVHSSNSCAPCAPASSCHCKESLRGDARCSTGASGAQLDSGSFLGFFVCLWPVDR